MLPSQGTSYVFEASDAEKYKYAGCLEPGAFCAASTSVLALRPSPHSSMSRSLFSLVCVGILLATQAVAAPVSESGETLARRALPTPVSVSTAKTYLSERE